ncbi:rhamnulokinase [Hamadaea flava]|uniref:Rhamnulokinase family protein n=1 Tax=Hamadaea flava TaxID=1742688 RepID=A0ABV8LUV8_9ACTN|nr:rhamnulokinase family protein [Hamadaea flava]MCP2329496.1 rhamnulokinase [Hamadaea flava]
MSGPFGSPVTVAAVDLGAASGRVMTGVAGDGVLGLSEAARFANLPVRAGGTLHWDILRLYRGVLDGLRAAGPVESIGVDSWAVDYGLLDADGRLLGNPVHYRDARTDGVPDQVLGQIPAERLYATTGLQLQPFNTIFQLAAARDSAQLAAAKTLLLIPDLLGYWLTGEIGAERTNASTTQLLDVQSGQWSAELATALGLPAGLLPPIRDPGGLIGPVRPEAARDIGYTAPVTAVGSHDTASAVVGVPAEGENFAYISCGTWSLVGVELPAPVLTADSRRANFTNEAGVDGTVRYLRNVMGLWLLQESLRAWGDPDLGDLLRQAAGVPGLRAVVDAEDAVFLPPGDMPSRIAEQCVRLGQRPPESPAETVRCILDSLALAHRAAVLDAQRLSGRAVDVVHVVGGGARNELLCQLTADACDLPVLAGPVEATALGNVLVQARAVGGGSAGLADLRHLIRTTHTVRRYEPQGDADRWRAAAGRL